MKIAKTALIVLGIYIAIVVLFESTIGYVQPESQSTLQITTFDGGEAHSRIVSRITNNGELYIAANHWPRAWFRQVLANPEIEVIIDDEKGLYNAVLVEGNEHERLTTEQYPGLFFRVLTGFPPRYFLKLEKQNS